MKYNKQKQTMTKNTLLTTLTAVGITAGAASAASVSVNLHLNTNDANMVDADETVFNGVTGAESISGANANNVSVAAVTTTTAGAINTNLIDDAGAASGVNLSYTDTGFTAFSNNSSPNQAATGNGGLGQSSLYMNTSETINLSGLSTFAPNGYSLILIFDSSNEHGGRVYGFAVNDGSGVQSLFTNDTNARDADTDNDGLFDLIAATGTTAGTATTDANFATYSGLTGNTLSITSATGTSGRSPLAGFQIVANPVPEPSSTALLGLGGLALILRRRK